MNNSLNKKWWIPREEGLAKAVLVEGKTKKKTLKDVLIYIKDNFEQLPGGHVDLNAVTINLCKDENWDKGLVELESIAVLFDSRVDEETGKTDVFFDVKPFKDLPNGASSVTTESIGLHAGILVKDTNGNIESRTDCVELCPEIYGDEQYIHSDLSRWAEYHNGYILDGDQCSVYSNGELFHVDHEPDTVYWSEWNNEYVDNEDDYVCYGCTNDSGYEDYFYNEDYIYCNDTDRYYASSDIAWNVDGVYWSDNLNEWTNKKADNAGYQSLARKFKMTQNTIFGVGFEIEKEDYDVLTSYQYQDVYDEYGWCKENDGSLDEDGFELVSPAFDLYTDDLDKEIESSKALQDMINAGYSTSCGGHITVSSSLYSAHEMLEGLSAFFPLLYALYDGRTENDYSRPKEKYRYHQGGGRDAIMSRGNRTVREADNKTFGAIEMRIFSGVRSVNNLLWRRDLVRIMTDNFGKSEKEVLRLLVNPKSKLFRHLNKVYTLQRIINKITLFASYSKEYNFKVIQVPDLQELLDKFKKAQENNDSTNELGA